MAKGLYFNNRFKGTCWGHLLMTNPLNLLEKSLQKTIMLVLKDGRMVEGKLTGFDTYMNMVLDDTDENFEQKKRKLGTVILRGNNVVSITPK